MGWCCLSFCSGYFFILHFPTAGSDAVGGNVPCVFENVESAGVLDCCFGHFVEWMVQYLLPNATPEPSQGKGKRDPFDFVFNRP